MAVIDRLNVNQTPAFLKDGVFDISEYNNGAVYTDLSDALGQNGANIPPTIRKGGMSIKFIQTTPAKYTVVKTENATEQPTGTEIQSDPEINSGTYTAGELSVFDTLPATLNSSLTYYLAVTETVDEQEVTTYTTWVITYVSTSDDNKYVQYRLMSQNFTTYTTQWQGVDDEPRKNSNNTIISSAIFNNLLAVNLLGCTNYICQGYVNSLGGLSLSGNFAENDADYKTLLVPVDPNKQYRYYNHCTQKAAYAVIYYGYFDANFGKLQNTMLHVIPKQWTDLVIPEGAAYFAMTIDFKDYSEAGDYARCCVVEVNKYYSYIEEAIATTNESITAIVNRIQDSLTEGLLVSSNVPTLTALNKALTYVTSLGTTQRCYNGYIEDNQYRYLHLNTGPAVDYQLILAKVTPGQKYDCFIYKEADSESTPYLSKKAFYSEKLKYVGGYGDIARNTWLEITAIEDAAYIAIVCKFGANSGGDYTKCYFGQKNLKLEEDKKAFQNSLSEGVINLSNKYPTQTALNKALTYVTTLGTTQRCYNGYINDPSRSLSLREGPATDYQTIIAKVTPGEKYDYFIYCDSGVNTSAMNYKYLGGIAFYDENLDYVGGYSVHSKNAWFELTAIEGAVYAAMVCKFGDGYGDYTKCYFGQKNLKLEKEFKSITKNLTTINNTIDKSKKQIEFTKTNFPQQLFLNGGYVTSSNYTFPVSYVPSSTTYQVLIIPVKEGEVYHYKMVETQGTNCRQLNCFANEDLTTKIPRGSSNNFTLNYGENIITIPSGVGYLCLTIKFGDDTSYDGAFLYLEDTFEDRIRHLENTKQSQSLGVRVKKSGTYLYIATKWDDENYLVQSMVCHRPVSLESNPNANLIAIRKVPYTNDISADGTLLKQAGDDICPAFVNGSYIAGNHGWNAAKNITCENHGKTIADVGAEYKDSNNIKFYILRIIDENTIQVISENKGTSGGSYDWRVPSGTLVYQSNGSSNTDIAIASVSSVGNFYGSVFEASYKLMGDNKNIIEDGLYDFKEFTLLENYDVADLPTVISALYNNRPENGYAEQPVFQNLEGVEKLFNRSVSYKFMSNGTCLVGTSLMAYKKCYLSFDGVVQSMYGGNRMYIPKLNSFEHDGVTYDFRKIEQWTSFYGRSFDSSSWENPNVSPDRFVNFDANNKFSIMLGYILDKGLEVDRNAITTSGYGAVYLASTLKLYPMAISGGRTLNVGDKYSVLAYRATSNHTFNPTGRTNLASVRVNNAIYVYIDYHGTLIDKIPVDDDWVGKDITIIEKTTNISLLTEDCVVGPIVINSQATVNNYGYIILKLTD